MRALTRIVGGALGSSRWTAVFTAVSRRVAREVAPASGGRAIEILPNGIDGVWRTVTLTTGATAAPRRIEFISVMRLNPKKRPATLVRIMAAVQRELPASVGIRLRIVGDGPERHRVERAILRRRMSHCVELTGRLSHDEIRDLYARSDVFVLPTIRESFGIAAAEARAAGLPVIARGDSGVGEWVRHERDGLLATSDEGLVRAMVRIATDTELRDNITAHNTSTTPEMDWALVLERHMDIYARAIALRRSVSA
jgi:glycosyltransferase involved in cell wall biosynthesis